MSPPNRPAICSRNAISLPHPHTPKDVAGPFLRKLPAKMEAMKDLPKLAYTSAREGLAEKFHMSEDLLSALNREGTSIAPASSRRRRPLPVTGRAADPDARRLTRAPTRADPCGPASSRAPRTLEWRRPPVGRMIAHPSIVRTAGRLSFITTIEIAPGPGDESP